MKRVVRSLLLFFCTTLFMLSASVCVCVVRVHADASYYLLNSSTCLKIQDSGSYYYYFDFNDDMRVVAVKNPNSSTRATVYFFGGTSSFNYSERYIASRNSSCVFTLDLTTNFIYNNHYYYSHQFNNTYINNTDIPLYDLINNDSLYTAYYYTYGGGAVDPGPEYGGLADIGYNTQISGQGNASINNVDVISWNDTFDTNNNDISAGNVRVRYVPGYYRSTSKQNLLAQTYQDFVLDIISAVNGDVYPVSDGSASFRWGDVIGSLSIPFYSIYNLTNSTEGWLKRGWIYEVRLEIDDYIGEWQTVYSSTSSGVENDMTIVNTTVVTQETITAIQNINSINDTTNIWIIYGQPVDPNPEITPPADDNEKPWWVYLLEMINNTLGIQNEYINEGTDESIDVVNNFEEDHDDLNVTVNDYDDIENDLVIDMNDNLDDLDIESDLIENNSFLSSARWVAEQYTRITTDNPIGSILKFSLVLGFVMIFLGRFK